MPRRYDPESLSPVLRAHPGRVLRRLWLLAVMVGGYVIAGWLARLSSSAEAASEREARAAIRFRDALVALGPTFIKIGQLLATRPDLVPVSFTRALATLQDRVPAYPTEIARRMIQEDLGADPDELFDAFDPVPLSAASIGQVYRARLRTGEPVAVKVQRPNLEQAILLDIGILRWFAERIEGRDLSWLGLPLSKEMGYVAIADRFAQSLFDQIDFVREAEHLERFRRNFRDFPQVTAPKPYHAYISERVLVEEYIEGFKFDDYAGIEGAGLAYVEVANVGVRAFIKQILEDGFFHADTHPGNVLVRPDGEVVYIDFGMVDTVPASDQMIMVDLFVHLVHLDFDRFIVDLVKLGFLPAQVDMDRVRPLVEEVYRAQLGLTERALTLREILDRVGEVMYDYPFYLPERFAFLMRSVSSMEGVVRSHVPHYQFLSVGLPYAGKLLLNPEQRAVREKLVNDLMEGDRLDLGRLLELFEYASREPTFRVGELAPQALDFLFSPEARRFRLALTRAALDPAVLQPGGSFEKVLTRLVSDPSLDVAKGIAAVWRFIPTPEGLEWVEGALPGLRHVTPETALGRVAPEVLERLRRAHSADALVADAVPAFKAILSDRAFSLQPALDWLATWIGDPLGRERVLEALPLLEELGSERRSDLLYVVLIAMQHPELDLAPLAAALSHLLTLPEGEALRRLVLGWVAAGDVEPAILPLLQRAWGDRALRGELVGALGPMLRFLGSSEGASTRRRMVSAAWERLAHFLPLPPLPAGESS